MRRESVRKILGLSAGLLVLGSILVAAWIGWTIEHRWADLRHSYAQLLEEARARRPFRPPARGAPVEGNSWDDYQGAMRQLQPTPSEDWSVLYSYKAHSPDASPARMEEILKAQQPALDTIRRGTRRTRNEHPIVDPVGGTFLIPRLVFVDTVGLLLACQVRFLAEAGRVHDAVEVALDLCRFGVDLDANALQSERSLDLFAGAFEELAEILRTCSVPDPDLEEIQREMELADRDFGHYENLLANSWLYHGHDLIEAGDTLDYFGPREWTFSTAVRYFHSARLMRAVAFDEHRRVTARLNDLMKVSWPECRRLRQSVTDELMSSRNPITRDSTGNLPLTIEADRERLAQLRILRVAAHYRQSGNVLELPDPFGTTIRTERRERKLKIWSVGPDGTDDGGSGTFKEAKPDLVLEVPR